MTANPAVDLRSPTEESRVDRAPIGRVAWIMDRPWIVAGTLALIFGLLIAVFTPPLTGGDERDHFDRAFQIAGGSILTTKHDGVFGAYLPTRLFDQDQAIARASYVDRDHTAFLNLLGAPTPIGRTSFISLANSASYGPGAYAAYVPAIAVGRLFGLSTLAILYLARVAGVVAYAGIVTLAVRRLPMHRWILVTGALLPAALNQASTVSADGLTMALCFLVVAEALFLSTRPERVRRSLVELSVAVPLLALAKPPYVLFALLLVIPAWRMRGHAALWISAVLGAGALLAAGWGSYQNSHSLTQDTPKLFLDETSTRYAFHHIEIHPQMVLIMTHPWFFFSVLGRTLYQGGLGTLQDLLGHLATYEEPWWIVILGIVTVAASVLVNERVRVLRLDRTVRVGVLIGVVAAFLGIYAIAYTNWNAYHAPVIQAVPARYFLPLLPWLLIGVLPSEVRIDAVERRLDLRLWLSIAITVLLSAAVYELWRFHFSGPPIFPLR